MHALTAVVAALALVPQPKDVAEPGEHAPMRVTLTFDDSLKDHLLIAAPLLESHGWRGTFNLVTDWVGKDERHLTWDDVRELIRRGHEVATHAKTHADLVKLLAEQGEAAVRRELAESRDAIADAVGFTPRYMCSPDTRIETRKYDDRWAVTMKIPLPEIGMDIIADNTLKAAFIRLRLTRDKDEKGQSVGDCTSWKFSFFHRYSSFGTLTLQR